jgi:hypothetical protein
LKQYYPIIKRPKDSTKTFGKVAGTKLIYKNQQLLYINNEQEEKEIRKIISFTTASKK